MRWQTICIGTVSIIVIFLCLIYQEGFDDYINVMARDRGYSGVKAAVDTPKNESALLSNTYFCPDGTVKSTHKYNNCMNAPIYPPTAIDNPYTTRELADGQRCVRDGDCYSKNCTGNICTSDAGSGYSPTGFYYWFTGLFLAK